MILRNLYACLFLCTITFLFSSFVETKNRNPYVSGGGTAIEGGARSTFVFNALQTPNGVVGYLTYHLRVFNTRFQMQLDCMEIRGNRATVSGKVISVSGENIPAYIFPGSSASFTVEDNGNGGNKDRISDVTFGANCDDDLDTYIQLQGNISIRQ